MYYAGTILIIEVGVTAVGHSHPYMYSCECLLPDKKCHPVSRLAKMSSSDTETRHPQLDIYIYHLMFFLNNSIIIKAVASILPNSTANANKNIRWQAKQTPTDFKAVLKKILLKAP
uniref:Uncharacterized protein n=1 Tax=Strix occidentalis caurina TaxID=311401 RepID=A0A8D0ELX9_STROC